MLKRTLLVVGLVFLAGALAYNNAQQKVTIDKVVAVVGNSIILYSEVYETAQMLQEERRSQGYTSDRDAQIEALEGLMEQKLLYNQALIDSVEISKEQAASQAEEYITFLLDRSGSVAQLEAEFHRPIYEIRREITNRYEEQLYAQSMRRELSGKISITPGEVERYYRRIDKDSLPIVPIQYVYSQITKYPLSTEEAKLRVREQLLGLRERIIGGARFDALALIYSQDEGTARQGGMMGPITLENLEPPFAKALEKLRPDQISEVVETIYGFHIIQMVDKTGKNYRFRHILIRPVFSSEEIVATNSTLDSIADVIRADSITFQKAALEHSDDKYSRLNGGLVSNLELMEMHQAGDASYATTKHLKEDLPPNDFRELDKLTVGQISRAFESADLLENKLCKIVKLIEVIPSHPATLQDDYLQIERLALNAKRQSEYQQWLNKKIGTMFVRIAPEFQKEEEFRNKAWLK